MRVSQQFADFIAGVHYESLPAPVIRTAKKIIIDTLAVAWAGAASPGCRAIYEMLAEQGGNGNSSVWGFGGVLPPSSAALVNGTVAAALDYDSLHLRGVVHAGIVILPAAFAIAEQKGASGQEFLSAFIAGYELMCRLGLSTPNHTGWFYTSIHGVFGAAAAASRILRLPSQQIEAALGAALSHAGGTQQAIVERSLTKRMQSAIAARSGLFSAMLAERGITAPAEPFEGKFGFYSLFERGDPAVALKGLGSEYELLQTTIKKFPSCGCNHAPIQAALDIRSDKAFQQQDIDRVEVHISPYMNRLVGAPFNPQGNPEIAAQFSVQYSVASALLRGHLNISDLQETAVLDHSIGEFARRVSVVIDEKNSGQLAPASVVVRLKSGAALRQAIDKLPGSPDRPITDDELDGKVRECLTVGPHRLTDEQAGELIARVSRLETLADMRDLLAGIGTPAGAARRRSA